MYWFLRVGLGLGVTGRADRRARLRVLDDAGRAGSAGRSAARSCSCRCCSAPSSACANGGDGAGSSRSWHSSWRSTCFAGYPQSAFHALLAAGAWALARARGADRWFLVRCLAGAVLGAGLAAVQLLPFLEYAGESAVLAYRRSGCRPTAVPPAAADHAADALRVRQRRGRRGGGGSSTSSRPTWGSCRCCWRRSARSWAGLVRRRGSSWASCSSSRRRCTTGCRARARRRRCPGLALGTNLRLMPYLLFAIARWARSAWTRWRGARLPRAGGRSGLVHRAGRQPASRGSPCITARPARTSLTWPLRVQFAPGADRAHRRGAASAPLARDGRRRLGAGAGRGAGDQRGAARVRLSAERVGALALSRDARDRVGASRSRARPR